MSLVATSVDTIACVEPNLVQYLWSIAELDTLDVKHRRVHLSRAWVI